MSMVMAHPHTFGGYASALAPVAAYDCHLSGRQLAALQLWACGYSDEQIDCLLGLGSVKKALDTLSSAARALGARDLGMAVKTALVRGLIV